jgi:hypothetical protein
VHTTLVLWWAVLALGAAIVAAVALKAWPLLHPAVAERAPLNPGCDLRERACAVAFDSGGSVRLDVHPRGIPPVRPLTLEVRLTGGLAPPERVEVDFAGVEMAMGFNRVTLARTPAAAEQTGDGVEPAHWRGEARLPVCVRARMTWEARVLLHYPGRLLAAPFRFDSVRPEVATAAAPPPG